MTIYPPGSLPGDENFLRNRSQTPFLPNTFLSPLKSPPQVKPPVSLVDLRRPTGALPIVTVFQESTFLARRKIPPPNGVLSFFTRKRVVRFLWTRTFLSFLMRFRDLPRQFSELQTFFEIVRTSVSYERPHSSPPYLSFLNITTFFHVSIAAFRIQCSHFSVRYNRSISIPSYD